MFSERYGFRAEKKIMLKTVSDTLRTRIWNLFYINEIKKGGLASKRISAALNGELTIEDKVADKLGIDIADLNAQTVLKRFITINCKWNEVYDFIEIYLSFVNEERIDEITSLVNKILEEEKSGYRVIDRCVTPITNKMELHEVNMAISSKYDSVNAHLKNALELYSNISSPDYNNSIKEAISAVEALCCIITDNPKATLGQAIKTLEENGVHIH